MPTCLITGSSGLVGSACVRHWDALGWSVWGLDNNARAAYFGPAGDTRGNQAALQRDCPRLRLHPLDLRDRDAVGRLVAAARPDLVIHTAAQPSHDWAAAQPLADFDVNAGGTLNLLEAVREFTPRATLCHISTNKVYGDMPNRVPWRAGATRYEHPDPDWPGFDEMLPIDQSLHSLFGCSKLAADIYVQEYGRYYGLNTVVFRCGCLTGGAQAGTEQHGFLAYLVRCCASGRPYTVYGHEGRQVRDQLHARDVARACAAFARAPRPGAVYNLGGGPANSVSVIEAIGQVEAATGQALVRGPTGRPRVGDHLCWITDTRRFRADYPGWSVTVPLPAIVAELAAAAQA